MKSLVFAESINKEKMLQQIWSLSENHKEIQDKSEEGEEESLKKIEKSPPVPQVPPYFKTIFRFIYN